MQQLNKDSENKYLTGLKNTGNKSAKPFGAKTPDDKEPLRVKSTEYVPSKMKLNSMFEKINDHLVDSVRLKLK